MALHNISIVERKNRHDKTILTILKFLSQRAKWDASIERTWLFPSGFTRGGCLCV